MVSSSCIDSLPVCSVVLVLMARVNSYIRFTLSRSDAKAMPMEPSRTRQVLQDLARTSNKLASELTADLSYAAREIESLREKFRGCERLQAKAVGLTEAQRNHRPMEQRRAVPPTRATLPVRKRLTAPRRAMNRPNQPTSPDRSSFRKSPSAPALHPNRALQETNKPRQRQEPEFGERGPRPISTSLIFPVLKVLLSIETLRSPDFA